MFLKRFTATILLLLTLTSLAACGGKTTTEPGYSSGPPTIPFTSDPDTGPFTSDPDTDSFTSDPDTDPFTSDPDTDPIVNALLSEEDMSLYKGSYDILYNRITDRGYAITSLTGTYFGMFTRDSSIQAMAHLAYGDSDSARSILRYLLSYHAALGLKRGTHIIDELKEESYRNSYLNGKGNESAPSYYDSQTEKGVAQYMLNAPNNAAATPFVTEESSVSSVKAYLEGAVSSTVVAEIYSDLKNPESLIGKGSIVLESNAPGFYTIPLEKDISLVPGTVYYLKLFATAGSGRVVWYGVNSGKVGYMKSLNYDLKSYGGDGWREFEAYLAFVIGENSLTVDNYAVAQRDGDTAIYRINAPANGGAQPFVPKNNLIYSVDLHLNKTKDSDTVNVMICTDYKDPTTSIGHATYTFGSNENGWQNVAFDTPVSVVPGNTYYLVVQATKESGNVVWNGTLRKSSCPKSYNYDEATFGGWTQGSSYLAFEILSFPTKTVAKSFEARGNKANSIDVTVFASKAGGRLKAEIRSDYTDPESALCSVQTELDHVGEKIYSLPLEKELALEYNRRYYLVVTFIDTNGRTRVMTDPAGMAKTYAFEESWMTIGYSLLCDVGFGADRSTIITLDGKTAGVQEIPTEGELITSVKVILARDEKTAGTIKATLYKGNDAATQKIDSKTLKIASLSTDPAFVTFSFDLPLTKTRATGNYYIRLETEGADGKVFWCGSTTIEGYETYVEKDGVKTAVSGEASFEAMKANLRLISDYTQTDATYMLIHAWVMYVNDNKGAQEDLEFIEQSYPIIKDFANYYLGNNFYNKKMNLILNPSLEHSKKGRYWIAYDLITNVFASQAFHELSDVARARGDEEAATKWTSYSEKIKDGIHTHLVTEVDGLKIYAEFYDAENNAMTFYNGISWVNFAPVAAEWYGMDLEIMKNTYEIYKKHAGIKMLGFDGLATDAFLGTDEIRRELIGKGVAWELMFCKMIGDTERIEEIVALELATSKKYKLNVYPESWTSPHTVSDPGNQEHCAWQVYAMSIVFPQLTGRHD